MNTILATCCTGNQSKHSFNPYTLCRWKLVTNPFSKFAMTAFRDVYFSVTNRADLGKKKAIVTSHWKFKLLLKWLYFLRHDCQCVFWFNFYTTRLTFGSAPNTVKSWGDSRDWHTLIMSLHFLGVSSTFPARKRQQAAVIYKSNNIIQHCVAASISKTTMVNLFASFTCVLLIL